MYSTLVKTCCSVVSTCTFNWPMVDFLQSKDESLDGTAPSNKRKGKHGKYNVEVHSGNTVHSI